MEQIDELERRIATALDRVVRGIEALDAAPDPAAAETARLAEALDEERMAAAQLAERLRAVKEREAAERAPLEAEIDRLAQLLDEQGLELQRMRHTVVQLRDQLRQHREAAEAGVVEPHLINRALLTELEALRAARLSEVAEMDGILSEIGALIVAGQGHSVPQGGTDETEREQADA